MLRLLQSHVRLQLAGRLILVLSRQRVRVCVQVQVRVRSVLRLLWGARLGGVRRVRVWPRLVHVLDVKALLEGGLEARRGGHVVRRVQQRQRELVAGRAEAAQCAGARVHRQKSRRQRRARDARAGARRVAGRRAVVGVVARAVDVRLVEVHRVAAVATHKQCTYGGTQ